MASKQSKNSIEMGKLVAKMRVAVRIRPPLPREIGQDGKFLSCVGIGPTTEKGQTIFINSTDKPVIMSHLDSGSTEGKISRYTFDRVFAPNFTQENVFAYTMEPLIQAVIDGYNATVLAYGQTGSGKTHTILGDSKQQNEGLTIRSIRNLLQDPKVTSINLSIIQIYQDVVFDLLSENTGEGLTLKQTYDGIKVDGLNEVPIKDIGKVTDLLRYAQKNRAVGGTQLNEVSSRSHMIICYNVRTSNGNSKLNLVDLAGSERLKDSKAEGQTLQETCAINSSLFALIAVVESLSSGKDFVPYRNSKLTWLLSDSIGGNSLTTILATVSPSQQYAKETKSTLKFAHCCKKIEHLVVKNKNKKNYINSKVKPVPSENILPWGKNELVLKSALVDTCWGQVCCYYSGNETGPPVIMLHGCPSQFSEFKHFLPCLTHYGFRVIGFDQPGYGNSPGVRANSRSDKAMEKGGPIDVLKEIIKLHTKEPPTLIGYDWGAGIALSFSVLYPARVKNVISFLPSFSETPDTQLSHIKTPTMILWVKRDTNHSWKHFKTLARKIPEVRIEFVESPIMTRETSVHCYEKISDLVMAPIANFLGKSVGNSTEKTVFKTKENVTQSTSGNTVIEVCNINFEDDFAQEEIDTMLEKPDFEVQAVKLFKTLGLRYGFHELYKAEEDHTHKLHQIVTSVFRSLPSINPSLIKNNLEEFVRLGILDTLPLGLIEMLESPRYFPGRKILIKSNNVEELQGDNRQEGITKIGHIVSVSDNSCNVALDPFENYGKSISFDVARDDIIYLNNPQRFYVEPTGKYAFEDGIHCSYENKTVKAKLIEIGFVLNKLVSKLNFLDESCTEIQKEAILLIRSCLNIVTFQSGVDRSRQSRVDNVGKLAVNGQVVTINRNIIINHDLHFHSCSGSLSWSQ